MLRGARLGLRIANNAGSIAVNRNRNMRNHCVTAFIDRLEAKSIAFLKAESNKTI